MKPKTREEAIKWAMERLSKYANTELGKKNVEMLRLYFEATPKTGQTIMNHSMVHINYLFPYLVEKNLSVEQLNEDNISEIASRMHQKPSSVRVMVQNILAFINWVRGKQRLQPLSSKYVVMKRDEINSNIIEDRLTDDHIRLIVNNLRDDEHKLAVLLMSVYGLRISEALGVRFSDFEFTENGSILTIRYRPGDYGAKGPKGERRIASSVLKAYKLVDESLVPTMQALILKQTRKYGKDARLIQKEKRAVEIAVAKAAERAGIPFRVHPHLFRHHFVAKAVKLLVPMNVLTSITGDRPETLDKYYQWLSPETLLR